MHRSRQFVEVVSEIDAIPSILDVVCRTTDMGFAALGQVTDDHWIACTVRDGIGMGIGAGEALPVGTTLCRDVRRSLDAVVIPDVAADPVYGDHPAPAHLGFRSYVAVPVVLPGGETFGTLCALDREPRDLSSPTLLATLNLFAQLIAFHLDAHLRIARGVSDLAESRRDLAGSRRDLAKSADRLSASRADLASSRADLATSRADLATSREEMAAGAASLVDERAASELREQFIAVLGHDLRNPLASIDAGAKLLAREDLSDRGRGVLDLIEKSVGRMARLIDDVLDFARGRLGGGIVMETEDRVPLSPMLRQVVDELRGAHPERLIDADIEGITDCRCDAGRVGQLLSNLVANAVTHGAPDSPIEVRGRDEDGTITLSVSNGGTPIPSAAMAGLFQPFVRASARPSKQGLGLGLYIASQIAKAHRGTLEAVSDEQRTVFTFRMPS